MFDKLFFFPLKPKYGEYINPYSQNFKDCLQSYFDVVDKDAHQSGLKAWGLLKYSTKADVYILNWVESIPFLKYAFMQYLIVMLALKIIKVRQSKIVWMFHNIRPHQGENWMTKSISKWLFCNATLIVSHSQEAASYAKKHALCSVEYRCHPVMPILVDSWPYEINPFDVFIWGAVLPYKGIVEFVEDSKIQNSNLTIKIIGVCKDKELENRINKSVNSHISYENKRADFSEIAANCKAAKFVLFPYVGESVSSSGALIDTIVLGGKPVGPDVGAFVDLKRMGVCLTYKDYNHLHSILEEKSENNVIDVDRFVNENSWQSFAEFFVQKLKSVNV